MHSIEAANTNLIGLFVWPQWSPNLHFGERLECDYCKVNVSVHSLVGKTPCSYG